MGGPAFIDKDNGYRELAGIFKTNNKGPELKVGFLLESGKHEGSDTSVAQVAAYHELGAPGAGIPERSFMRSSMDENKDKITSITKKLTRKVTNGEMNMIQALEVLGASLQQMMKTKIRNGLSPALKHRKGTPLIDTGQLINSIDYEVDK